MKIPVTRIICSIATIGAFLLASQPLFAQTTTVNPLQDFEPQDSSTDPFSSSSNSDSFGLFNLIHRANLGTTRSFEEFATEQNESLDQAAKLFRARQQQLLQQNGQVSPAAIEPVTTPDAAK